MAYFGFLTMPFCKGIEPQNLFLSRLLTQLLDRLETLIGQRGIALISGDVGAGKTCALRAFTHKLDARQHDIIYIDNPAAGMRAIFNSAAGQLNIEAPYHKWKLAETLKTAIEKNFRDYKKSTLFIIDDAHLLKNQELEELRVFNNFRFDAHAPLTLILIAQPELNNRLRLGSLQAFNQRIILRATLAGIDHDEAKPYIASQLEAAGRVDPIFSENVVEEIFQQARGLPRLINTLCRECLFDIARQNKQIVDGPVLEKILLQY